MFAKIKQRKYRADVSTTLHQYLGVGKNALARITEVNSEMLNDAYLQRESPAQGAIKLTVLCAIESILHKGKPDFLSSVYGKKYVETVQELGISGFEYLMNGPYKEYMPGVICMLYSPGNATVVELATKMFENGILDKSIFADLNEKGFCLSNEAQDLIWGLPIWMRKWIDLV